MGQHVDSINEYWAQINNRAFGDGGYNLLKEIRGWLDIIGKIHIMTERTMILWPLKWGVE